VSATATYRRQPRRERWERDIEANAAFQAEKERRRCEREDRLRPKVRASQPAKRAWEEIQARLLMSLPKTAFDLWIAPLGCIGEADGALCIEGPPSVLRWTERRYGSLLGMKVRELTGYRGLFLFVGASADESEDGCL